MSKIYKREFWVTNISRKYDVSLSDLRLTIRRGESRNLLDSNHYTYTTEQLEQSAKTGSIFAKSSVIKVRDVAPQPTVTPGKYLYKGKRLVKELRSPAVKIEKKKFEDLDFLDEHDETLKFAEEQADMAFDDHKPATLFVDKKFDKDNK